MKIVFVLLALLSSLSSAFAQNLVPNPSFEEYEECPTEVGQVFNATGWYSALESPDYFNACSSSNDVNTFAIDVPINHAGFQEPATGSAYIGLFSFFIVDDYREYVQCQLLEP